MTMAALAPAVQEKHLQDWLKGALATLFAKQGLEDFVADELTKFQKDLLTSVFKNKAIPEETVCNTCTTENVLSCPTEQFCSKGKCKLHDQSKQDKRPNHPCPNNVCQYIRDAIRQEHRHNSPSWTNTNATKWCIDSFEIAKCYMPLDDYDAVTTLKGTDFDGILSVIMNNNRFKEKMVDTDHACTKALDTRHKIRHSEDISLRDGELAEYADTLIDLLSDPKYLAADQKAQLAVHQLKQLKSNTLTIDTEDITGVIDEIMNDLDIMQKVNNATTKEMAKTNGSKIQVNTRLLQQLLLALKSTLSSVQTATVSNLDEVISTEVTSIETKWKEDLDTIPADPDLVDIARAIGLNWDLLGIHLGLSTTEIDHIKMDYPTSQTRIYRMLYIWRKEEGLNATKGILFSALRNQASVNIDWKAIFGKCLMYEVHQPKEEMSSQNKCERETPVDVTDSASGSDSATGQTEVLKSMREDLIRFYRKHHSTLSVSPLVEEHDVQLTDFYVQPKLTAIDIQRRFGILGKTQRRTPILSYRDLFCQGGNEFYKDIYVTAKAGVGKTSFAKRVCMTWCQAHSRDRLLDEKFRSEDVEEMRKFDLLLMLSLRDTDPTICDLDSMIFSGLIRDLARRSMYSIDVLEDMLQQRTCLVILDGLDEWTHPAACDRGSCDVHNLPHIPARELCTVMITTRPWKFDVIQLRMKQIDRHVEINELDDQLSEQLTSNAVTILNELTIPDKAKTTEEFKTATSPRRVDSVKYIPYILLQMICLWFEGKTIGKSKCEIYSNIIELTLSRGLMKLQRNGVSTRTANNTYTNKVPFFVRSNKLSQMHYDVLLRLGKVAFETLFSSKMESRLIFDRSTVLDTLSEGTVTFCLQMGLLSQRKDETTISSRTSKLSFQHKSIQEYFAALYIQSCIDGQDVQDKILKVCESLAAVIEMADVFVFIGGFCQETCEKILEMLYPITSTSETTQIYRNSQSQYELSFQDRKSHEMIKSFQMMQIEIAQELKDSGSKKINFCIEDILIDRTFDEEQLLLLKHLTENSGNIKSLGINCGSEDEFRKVLDTVELQKLCFLQKLRIFGIPGHEDLHRLLSDAAQSLTCLCLSFCINENNQYFSAHQTISPETIRTITNMNQLQSINLWNIHLEHPQMEAFFIFLCRKETMTEITLSGMKCTEHGGKCESHSIDLSQHGKLRLLHLAFISVSDIRVNSTSLDTCIFGPLPTHVHASLVRCLQGASCLKSLHINNGKLLGDMPEILPRLGQLRMFGVMGIDLCEKALTLPPELKYIENVIFYMVTMSNAALKLFVESVNILPQPVTIGLTECNVKLSKDDEQRIDYEIRSSSGYRVITDDSTWFKFHTCKQL